MELRGDLGEPIVERLRRIAALAAVALALCGPALAQPAPGKAGGPDRIDTLKRIRDSGAIALGVREASIPFSFLDAQRQPQGYSVELCQRIVDAIRAELKLPRLEIRYVPVSSADRIARLREGRIDLECGSTTNTRKRQEEVAFAYTTFVAGIKLLAKKASNVGGLEDLRGKTVVVTRGTTSEAMIRALDTERGLGLTILEAGDHNESFRAVDEGRAVAFPMDDVLLYGLISKSRNPDAFAVVGRYLSVEPYAIMLRKDDAQLERIVNRTLNELFQSGEIRRIYARWFATRDLTVPLSSHLREAFAVPNTYPAWP